MSTGAGARVNPLKLAETLGKEMRGFLYAKTANGMFVICKSAKAKSKRKCRRGRDFLENKFRFRFIYHILSYTCITWLEISPETVIA